MAFEDKLELGSEACSRICDAAECGQDINPAILENAAGFYWNMKRRAENSAGRGSRRDLRFASKQCKELADMLDGLPLGVSLFVIALRGLLGPECPSSEHLALMVA